MELWEDIRSTVLGLSADVPNDEMVGDNQEESQGVVKPTVECGPPQPAPHREARAHIEHGATLELDRHGTFLDETVLLRDPEGQTFTELVLAKIAGVEVRKRARRPVDQQSHEVLVRCILANGLRCYWHRDPPAVSYLRKSDAYKAFGFKPDWLNGRAIGVAVGLMQQAGLLETWVGTRGNASRFTLSEAALSLAAVSGATKQSLHRSRPKSRLIELRGPKSKSHRDSGEGRLAKHKGEIIPFEESGETEAWLEAISAYNAFIARQSLTVDAPDEILSEWLRQSRMSQSQNGARLTCLELFETDIYRVFNNASFEQGGRLYGGWWINAPRSIRPYIRINGRSTVELDFASCQPRMLYHERGLECEGDLYELPEISQYARRHGLPANAFRDFIKWLMQVLINGKGRSNATIKPEGLNPPDRMTNQQVTAMIRQRHAPIADAFNSQAGVRLMREESDIALRIISQAAEAGWAVLPIHDSFIAEESRMEELTKLMEAEYHKSMKFYPSIKQH